MRDQNRRRVLTALGTGAVVAVAGCIGDGDDSFLGSDDDNGDDANGDDASNGDDAPNGDDSAPTDDGTDDTGTDDPGLDGEFDRDVWEPMQFTSEARYEWDLFIEGEDGSLVWDVVAIDGDQITVETEFTLGDAEFTQTVTGTQQELEGELILTPAAAAFTWTAFSPMWGGFIGEEFTVGDEWSYSTPEGSLSYAVADTDTTSYPVDCYVVEMHEDDQLLHEGCISPDHGMAIYTAWYDEGDLEIEIELVSFTQH